MKLLISGAFLTLVCVCAHPSALTGQAVRPRSLPDILSLAVENSVDLQKGRLDRQALDQEIRQRAAAAWPQVSGVVQVDYAPYRPIQFWPTALFGGNAGDYIPVEVNQPWQTAAVVRLDQSVYNMAALRMAPARKVSRSIADLSLKRGEEEVLFHTANLFYKILQMEQLLEGMDANLERLTELHRIATLMLENDYAIPTDVKRLQVAMTNLETRQHNLTSSLEVLKQNLQFICNLPFDQPLELAWGTETPVADSLKWQNMILDVESSTEVRMLKDQIELHRIRRRSQYGEVFPSLSAYATGGWMAQRQDAVFLSPENDWYGMAQVGFRLKVPVFDGFLHRHQSNILRIEGEKLALDSDRTSRSKALEFNQSYAQYRNALNLVHTQEENVALARDITNKLFLQYKEGEASLTDLLNAQTALSEAETNYWNQVFDYKLSVIKLLKAAGRLDELRR
jgi:outer membrane protein